MRTSSMLITCTLPSADRRFSLQVNVVSSSILAILLLPIMLRTSRERHTIPRTVVVASSVHFWAPPWNNEIFSQPEILKALSDQEEFE